MSNEVNLSLTLDDRDEAVLLFGNRDAYLRMIRDSLGVRLVARGDTVQMEGPEEKVQQAERVFLQLRQMLQQQGKLSGEDVRTVLAVVQQGGETLGPAQPHGTVGKGMTVRPRTDGQARYVKALHDNDITVSPWSAPPSRPANALASFPAIWWPRSIHTSDRSLTLCAT
jgi:phosphate starvation-inducible PhoH-like protein